MSSWIPPDQSVRDRILTDLQTNLLVEAGAGSGKTTAMVGRMVELIRTGTGTVDQIAAVTFTRKAAAELRERFQVELEGRFREAVQSGAEVERDRLQLALAGIDSGFVGTIHSFCGRLLRERPLEAGVSPDFQEISGGEADRSRTEFWDHFLEKLSARGSRLLSRLDKYGLRPARLTKAFLQLSENPDVDFPADRVERANAGELDEWRGKLTRLLDETLRLMPSEEPEKGWCPLQKVARNLRRERFYPGWNDDASFMDSLAYAVEAPHKPTYKRWPVGMDEVKAIEADWDDLCDIDGPASALVEQWLACRYPVVLRFMRAAAREYAHERLRSGRLTFQDLLMLSARLLRTQSGARRDLGDRYRFILVDEFQDTDPVQAEVLLLLAARDDHVGDWADAVPRPGALFVVGDPKQSIYRFRRADIAVYNQVKERFKSFGAVVSLVANFRSSPPIEMLVDRVFASAGFLPPEETDYQAAFAPLRVEPRPWDRPGIRWYRFDVPGRYNQEAMARYDAAALSSWIAAQVETGERTAGDFLILTTRKAGLQAHAQALEERGIPVQVTGSGVGLESELEELVLLLRALADPGDGVLTVAVLEGLFFGLSHQDLVDHVRLGGAFDCSRAGQPEGSRVGDALQQMNRYWRWFRDLPADAVVPRIVEELGLLPFAVAGQLGATRAGALIYALDALRIAGLDGQCSLVEAVEVLENALEQEVETPLIPGRQDVVRVMNLHKAKGLQAPVVVLAYPLNEKDHEPEQHILREPGGRALGFFEVHDSTRRGKKVVARPQSWSEHAGEEARFQAAEAVRLLYVAATRAAEELVVSRCTHTEGVSVWRCFDPVLDDSTISSEIAIEMRDPIGRGQVDETATSINTRVEEIARRRATLAQATFRTSSVTSLVKGSVTHATQTTSGPAHLAQGRGIEWGRVVHQAVEAMGRGLSGDALHNACQGYLIQEGRPADDRGVPTELEELLELVKSIGTSQIWGRARAAKQVLLEVPFLVGLSPFEAAATGLRMSGEGSPLMELVEGVIDLAFEEADGWVIADYKTDVFSDDGVRAQRTQVYRRQVDAYASCWERLTGSPVKERVLVFTDDRSELSWKVAGAVNPLGGE